MALQRAASRRRAEGARRTSGGPTGFTYSATFGGAQLEGEPYTVAPGSDFSWFRSRILGGRTNHYGRVTLRLADYDFKPQDTRRPWLRLADQLRGLAPYYDKAERFIGVTGTNEGIRSAPDGIFNPPAPLRAHDVLVQRSCAKLGIRAIPARQAVTTVPRNGRPRVPLLRPVRPRLQDGVELRRRATCRSFRRCRRAACRCVANAMARELITDDTGKVTAVSYIDKTTGTEKQVRCRTVVLAGERVRVGAAAAQLEVAAAIRRASRTPPARSGAI